MMPTFQRLPIALQAVFALVSGCIMFLLPDTPRWYFTRGRHEEGDAILARLHDRPLSDPAVFNMRNAILSSLELEEEESNRFRKLDLFWDRGHLKAGRRIRIAFLILCLQQMMGMFSLHYIINFHYMLSDLEVSTFPYTGHLL